MGRRDQVDAERYNHFVCPNCGGEVRIGSIGCPHCGSDDQTGWSDEAETAALDLPGGYSGEDAFDYDRFVREEFGTRPSRRKLSRALREVLIGMVVTLIGVAVLYSVLTV